MAVAALTLSMGAASCSDDDDDDEFTTSVFVPEKIVVQDSEGEPVFYTISYNSDLKIIAIDEWHDATSNYQHIMEYDSEGRISKITYTWDDNTEILSYTYSGDKVTVLFKEDGYESTKVYTVNTNVVSCVKTDEYGVEHTTYTYDANDRLAHRKIVTVDDTKDYEITYNNEVTGISKDINMSKVMAISLSETEQLGIDFLTVWDKGIATWKDIKNNETINYTYTKLNSNGYPEVYKEVEEELTMTVTYKEIKK